MILGEFSEYVTVSGSDPRQRADAVECLMRRMRARIEHEQATRGNQLFHDYQIGGYPERPKEIYCQMVLSDEPIGRFWDGKKFTKFPTTEFA